MGKYDWCVHKFPRKNDLARYTMFNRSVCV